MFNSTFQGFKDAKKLADEANKEALRLKKKRQSLHAGTQIASQSVKNSEYPAEILSLDEYNVEKTAMKEISIGDSSMEEMRMTRAETSF